MEITPVTVKTFNENGVKEIVSHYLGFIHGIANTGLKNLYMAKTRREIIDQMFATLQANQIQTLN